MGQSIRRVEDPKFLLGRGGYIADRITPGTLHAAVLRSPFAHARIGRIETAAALAAPGVHAVITGREAAELCDPMPDFGPDPAKHTWRCLAAEKVRYVGEGVAVVVADSRYLAEDALRADRGRVRAAAPGHRPGARARRRVPAGARGAGVELRLRAQLRLRRRRA